VSGHNHRGLAFYRKLGFRELGRIGSPDDQGIFLGLSLAGPPAA